MFRAVLCFLCVSIVIVVLVYVYAVYPEIGMVVNSQCNNPTPNWNGKVLNIPVWKNGFEGRNETHNSYLDTTADRRRRLLFNGFSEDNAERILTHAEERPQDPIIIWGSHHKTGTYVAQKAFSHVCKVMGWCCIFHVTRDSMNVIRETLQNEPIKVLGHTQWIWDPKELGLKNYRFIHFFRKPYRKILSGYRYHKDGAEAWCLKSSINYTRACDFSPTSFKYSLVPYSVQIRDNSFVANNTTPILGSEPGKDSFKNHGLLTSGNSPYLSRTAVQEYCQSVHLCEPCCRRAHETLSMISRGSSTKKSSDKASKNKHSDRSRSSGSTNATSKATGSKNDKTTTSKGKNTHQSARAEPSPQSRNSTGKMKPVVSTRNHTIRYLRTEELLEHGAITTRDLRESSNTRVYKKIANPVYEFLCRNLGPMSGLSLTDTLTQVPPDVGLRVEASIDYFETLRMAYIFNKTWNDPYSLNIDLDELMRDYSGTMAAIVTHMDLGLSPTATANLVKELNFYDVTNSPAYRWSMTNPFVNHVDTKSVSDPTDYTGILNADESIARMYAPILDLMYWGLQESRPLSAAGKRIAGLKTVTKRKDSPVDGPSV